MDKIQKLQEEKKVLEKELREVNFKMQNEPENRNNYIIPREVFKIKRQIKIKEIEIERLKNKLDDINKKQPNKK